MGIWLSLLSLLSLSGIFFSPKLCVSQNDAGRKYRFMRSATTARSISYYDYIVIGGGTAGCPLAATLSKSHNVLLLERGASPYGNPNITNLAAFGAALSDTSPSSPAQRFISQDGVINSRARVLGGGTCLNAGFYTRASSNYVRDVGWDQRLVNESYEWVERVVTFEPTVKQWQLAVRDGLLEVGVLPYNGFNLDHIVGTKVGGTIFDNLGHRHTAADLLQYANPSRITLLLHATVHRILFKKGGSRPVAYGVIFMDELGGEHRAYLMEGVKNEIIVSAGALGSPQLLMLSGIGAAQQLKEHKINVVLNQPMVGQGMSDNPMNAIYVPSPIPVEVSLIEVVGITRFGSYIEAASGENFGSGSRPDQASGLQGGFILEKIIGPISTGHMELRNNDPNENPLVTFNYFQDPRDLERCVQGIRTIQRVIQSKAFSPFRFQNMSLSMLLNITSSFHVNLLPQHASSSSSLEQFCKDTVMTIWHYHGGCQVGRVVDADYKVLGVDSLRVIDGSTFLSSPGTNPQATVMMLGRYMGIKILRERFPDDEEK